MSLKFFFRNKIILSHLKEMKKTDQLFASTFKGIHLGGLFCDGPVDVDTTNNMFKVYFALDVPFETELNVSATCGDLTATPGYVHMWSDTPGERLIPPNHSCASVKNLFNRYLRVEFLFLTLKATLLCLRGSRGRKGVNMGGKSDDFSLALNELGI